MMLTRIKRGNLASSPAGKHVEVQDWFIAAWNPPFKMVVQELKDHFEAKPCFASSHRKQKTKSCVAVFALWAPQH